LVIKNQKDFYSGAMFVVIGGGFAVWSYLGYRIGTGLRMGPGYFPFALGILLAVLGVIIAVKALMDGSVAAARIGAVAWRPLLLIITANLLFGVAIGGLPSIGLPPVGLIAGIFVVTFVASLAGDEFQFFEVFVVSGVLAALSYLAFIVVLRLQIPVWPFFIVE
jgi:hypothetical protein